VSAQSGIYVPDSDGSHNGASGSGQAGVTMARLNLVRWFDVWQCKILYSVVSLFMRQC